MKYSYRWLKDYVGFEWEPDELARRMTLAGLEVGQLEPVGDDVCLHVEVTSNRPDWNGHLGAAREIAALTGNFVQRPDAAPRRSDKGAPVQVEVQDAAACPRYTAQLIKGVKVGPSPDWLQQRLTTVGLRPINVIVDVTNYVMLEYNQPLHAFDYDKLKGGRIVVRRAAKGESMLALDGKKYALTREDLVIADAERPVAVAGVMGGEETEIDTRSVNVLLESAAFDPVRVRTTSRRLGLASDSSYRFERGVDVSAVMEVSNRAAQLIVELAGGEVVGGATDVGTQGDEPAVVTLTYGGLRKALSLDVGLAVIEQKLASLDLEIVETGREGIRVRVPGFRPDLRVEVDLIEEVARLHGLDKIPTKPAFPVRVPRYDARAARIKTVHDVMTGAGYFECLAESFLLNRLDEYQHLWNTLPALTVRNPIRAEQAMLRKSLLPSLLLLRKNNENAGNRDVRLYEVAHVYHCEDPSAGRIKEPEMLGILGDVDFAAMKGLVTALLSTLHIDEEPVYAPVRNALLESAASISFGKEVVGYLGRASKGAVKAAGLKNTPWLAELRVDKLFEKAPEALRYKEGHRYPPVLRDLAIVVKESVRWRDVLDTVRAAGGDLLRDARFFDLFRGDKIGAGNKSLAFSLVYQAPDRTLTAAEVDEVQSKILAALKTKLAADVRA